MEKILINNKELEWHSLKPGGRILTAQKLSIQASELLQIVTTREGYYRPILFIFLPIIMLLSNLGKYQKFIELEIIIVLICLIYGIMELIEVTKPINFNKRLGLFWKGKGNPQNEAIGLKDIVALQIISEVLLRKHDYIESYEVNLVLKNGARINIIDQIKSDEFDNIIESLKIFLDVPVYKNY